jgi:hypothetical protein
MDNRVLTVLRKGEKVTVLGESGYWLKVSRSGTVGYASKNYLSRGGSSAASVSTSAQSYSASVPQVKGAWNDYNYAIRKSSGLYRQVDVNGDGLNNCIDAAVTFYKYYGDKSKVQIVHNTNPNTGLNHLFNRIWVDGRWVDVEPQTLSGGGMRVEWIENGVQRYDPAYNRDETDYWSRFVR